MNVLKPLGLLGRNGGGTTMESVSAYAANFMRKHARLAPYASRLERNPDVANLMVAWLIAEASEPLRIAATGALVTLIARQRGQAKSPEGAEYSELGD
jgi:hypothetical protein